MKTVLVVAVVAVAAVAEMVPAVEEVEVAEVEVAVAAVAVMVWEARSPRPLRQPHCNRAELGTVGRADHDAWNRVALWWGPALRPRNLPCCTNPAAPTLPRNRVPYVQPERMFLLLNAYLENKPLQRATKAQVSKG